jgi:lipopolysaccharide/colanic/teichoic acid biosynthesis glycosyltransferase
LKQVVDRTLAVLGLVVASPFLAAAAIGIKISSAGPVLYRAQRAGMGGSPFAMFKLRTMRVGTGDSARITGADDPRVFMVGNLLRRCKLDEVPQLVNVARGEMALVGPRPEDVSIVRDHYDDMMWESLTVLPGLTSPGSLSYFADEAALPDDPAEAEAVYLSTLLPHKIAMDLVYVRSRTARYDVQIVLRTLLSVLGLDSMFRRTLENEEKEAQRILGGVR